MKNLKLVPTPLVSNYKLSDKLSPKTIKEQHYTNDIPYAYLVDSIMCAIVCLLPNITYAWVLLVGLCLILGELMTSS